MAKRKINQRGSEAKQQLHQRQEAGPAEGKKSHLLPASSVWQALLISLFLFGVAFCAFLPATQNNFVCYDDPEYVTENPFVQSGLTMANLEWALSNDYVNWHPLTWLSHMTDCEIFGLKPWGHHLTNVLLHALNTALLFLVLLRMTGASGRCLLVALLFGLHPLRVESVAWVAERKDVLGGLFFMLTLLAYAQFAHRSKVHEPRPRLFYGLAMLAFALGLLSKPILVTVPFVLLLLDWWPLKRFSSFNAREAGAKPPPQDFALRESERVRNVSGPRSQVSISCREGAGYTSFLATFSRLVCEKLPFFFLAMAVSIVTFKAQQSSGAVMETLTLAARAENALVSYCRYLGKLFWPVDLAAFYPHPHHWPVMIVLACGVFVLAASILAVAQMACRPYLTVGWFWYLGMLIPVIGLVQVGSQSMADRYTYLPTIGILIVIVWGIHELAGGKQGWKVAGTAAGAAGVLACAVMTWRQVGYWKDSETLFRHAIAVTKNNYVALDSLGRALGQKGQVDEGIKYCSEALSLNANDSFAHNGLGAMLMLKRDYDGAALHLQEALRINPNDPLAHANLGVLLAKQGHTDEAINHLEEAVKLKPYSAEVQNNLGALLVAKNRLDEGISHYRLAIRLKPDDAKARKNLGVALVKIGRLDEAIEQFREALRLQCDFAEAQDLLRQVLELKVNNGPPAHP